MMFNQAPSSHLPIITCHNLLNVRDFKGVQRFVELNRLVGNDWHELDQAEAISDVIIAAENRLPNRLTDYYGMIRATRLGPVVLDDFLRLMKLLDGRSNHFPCSNEAACYAMEAWTFLSKPDTKGQYDLAISNADKISGQNRQAHVVDNRVNNRWGGVGVQGSGHGHGDGDKASGGGYRGIGSVQGGTNRGNNGFGGNERFNGNGECFGSGHNSIGGGECGVDDRFGAIFGGGSSRQGIGAGAGGVNGVISTGNGGFGRIGGGRDIAGDRSGKGISSGLDAIFGGSNGEGIGGGEGEISGHNYNISSGGFNNIDGSLGGGIDIAGGFGGVKKEKQKVETVWSICSNCYIMHENEVCMRCNKVTIEFESTTNMIPSGLEKGEDQYSHLAGMLQSRLPESSSFIPKEQNLGREIEDVMVVISDDDSNGDGDEEIMTMARTSKLCTINGKRVKMIPLKKKKP